MTSIRASGRPLALAGVAGLALAVAAGPVAAQLFRQDDPPWIEMDVAVLQGLDKITARISTFDAPIGMPVRFGTLVITARTCAKRPPTETPESAAYLDIDEQPPDEESRDRFAGWMFASSPALNPLQHPVYDVWVIDCRSSETKPQSSSPQ